MSKIANELPEPKWMNGSGSMSKKTYMVVARRGDICLGIKLEGMVPGDKLKMPGKTYLLFRVRSARQPDLFAAEDAQQKVVPLNGNMGLDEAWPSFTFDVVNSSRASAAVGVFIDGSLLEDPAAFCEKFIDGDYVGKSIDYVLSRAGEDNVILPRDVIVETFTEKLDTLFSQVKDWHDQYKLANAVGQEFQKAIEDDVGVVGQQAAQLKSIYDKHAATFGDGKGYKAPPHTEHLD